MPRGKRVKEQKVKKPKLKVNHPPGETALLSELKSRGSIGPTRLCSLARRLGFSASNSKKGLIRKALARKQGVRLAITDQGRKFTLPR